MKGVCEGGERVVVVVVEGGGRCERMEARCAGVRVEVSVR